MSQHFHGPLDALPLHRPPASGRQFHARLSAPRWSGGWPFAVLPPLALLLVFAWNGTSAPEHVAAPQPRAVPLAATAPLDAESAQFLVCGSGPRAACVVDGDTFWYRGTKIRIADINTPETSSPGCPAEAALGARAAARLTELLNAGPFSLERVDLARDRYGRELRIVTRGGRSLGERLVGEGLAERWQGFRRAWC